MGLRKMFQVPRCCERVECPRVGARLQLRLPAAVRRTLCCDLCVFWWRRAFCQGAERHRVDQLAHYSSEVGVLLHRFLIFVVLLHGRLSTARPLLPSTPRPPARTPRPASSTTPRPIPTTRPTTPPPTTTGCAPATTGTTSTTARKFLANAIVYALL